MNQTLFAAPPDHPRPARRSDRASDGSGPDQTAPPGASGPRGPGQPQPIPGALPGGGTADCCLEFRGVARRFGDRAVLRGLDLQVRPGQIHALLGRNGSGKTTALRILLGFLAPHAGQSFVLGKPSDALGPDDRGRIGYVSEDHHLYRGLRVAETVAFEAGTRARFDRGFADRALARCGLTARARVGQLSRGQRAQLALVLAVASRPEVLVLDDPALGLDVVMRRELLEVMIDLLADRGLGVLFSSHFLDDVERVADRISILHGGRLIVDAATDDIKRRVQRRTWSPPAGASAAGPPAVPGLLRADRRQLSFELTLVDCDAAAEARLTEGGAHLGPPTAVTVEDLFLALTREQAGGLLADPRLAPEVAA
jgi:ABC-2 type transport system ATP-binding protein